MRLNKAASVLGLHCLHFKADMRLRILVGSTLSSSLSAERKARRNFKIGLQIVYVGFKVVSIIIDPLLQLYYSAC